jgi:hypothetical protein
MRIRIPNTGQQYGHPRCIHFHRQHVDVHCAGCTPFTTINMDVQDVFLPPSAVRTCRVYPFHHLQCGCAGCTFLLMPDFSASGLSGTGLNRMFQSGTGITGTSSVLECFVTGLRYRMPECRCPAMVGRCHVIP